MINSSKMASIYCGLMIIHIHLHFMLQCIVREISGWTMNETNTGSYYITLYKHYGIEIAIESYWISWEIVLCEMPFGSCTQPIH